MAIVSKYQKHISGPILDRIDIRLDVSHVLVQKLAALDGGKAARAIPRTQSACVGTSNVLVNGDIGPTAPLSPHPDVEPHHCRLGGK